jgi:hypothetical protein
MGTVIKITPPSRISADATWDNANVSWENADFDWDSDYSYVQEIIGAYESCSVNMSITERAGSFSLTLPFKHDEDISRFVVGSDVQIIQNGHVFRGWVIKPPVARNGAVKTITLDGADYTAKTQKIVVTESYTDAIVSEIVSDLFLKYVSWATRVNIGVNERLLTIKFPDVFLWDAMEQICNLSGFDWFIDENLDVNFFQAANAINENVITDLSYKRGTARFEEDSSKLVNKLWVKGAKAMSLPYEQAITVTENTPIPLYYKPRSGDDGIGVVIGGVPKTLGIQNIHAPGTYDFLLNVSEKLLIPDLVTTGTGTITYRYEYPIKILLENEESKAIYGEFEDILNVDITDSAAAREVGTRWIEKYSKTITVGSIEPLEGIYHCGELVKVELPSFGIDEYLVIKSVSYESVPLMGMVNIRLSLENLQTDLSNILKDINKRLRKIETALFGDDTETVIETYKTALDSITYPKLSDGGYTHKLHDYVFAGSNIVGGVFTI